MATFKDTDGRTWDVRVTVGGIKDVRELLKVDLLDNTERGGILGRLEADPVLVCDVVYVLCKDQAEKEGVTSETFGRAMGGDVLAAATDALLEAYIGFFRPHQRTALGKIKRKLNELETMVVQSVEARLESGVMEREMKAELEAAWTGGARSTGTPESSASTPTP